MPAEQGASRSPDLALVEPTPRRRNLLPAAVGASSPEAVLTAGDRVRESGEVRRHGQRRVDPLRTRHHARFVDEERVVNTIAAPILRRIRRPPFPGTGITEEPPDKAELGGGCLIGARSAVGPYDGDGSVGVDRKGPEAAAGVSSRGADLDAPRLRGTAGGAGSQEQHHERGKPDDILHVVETVGKNSAIHVKEGAFPRFLAH